MTGGLSRVPTIPMVDADRLTPPGAGWHERPMGNGINPSRSVRYGEVAQVGLGCHVQCYCTKSHTSTGLQYHRCFAADIKSLGIPPADSL
jgi:hypothetical protein